MKWIAAVVVLLVHVVERDDEDHVVLLVDNHFVQ